MANQTTSQTLNEALESFEAMVKELIELGYSVDMAVQIAYKDFPIMEMLEAPLQANLVHNFKRGFHKMCIRDSILIVAALNGLGIKRL